MGFNDKYKIVGLENLDDCYVDCPNCINDDGYGKVTEIHHNGTVIKTTNHYVCLTCGLHLKILYHNSLPKSTAILTSHFGTENVLTDSTS